MKNVIALTMLTLCAAGASGTARAGDVTSVAARERTLLEYVAARADLSTAERQRWEKAIRLTFGGKAIKKGSDEGVTAAKSVIAGAIFHGIPPDRGAKAAYDAYHDTYGWVPPPLAVNYQLLAFQGRKPTVSAKRLAFEFPKYFNADLAPDMVTWWAQMLEQGKVPEWERAEIERLLKQTRALMKPMLVQMLWRGSTLQARSQGLRREPGRDATEVNQAIESLVEELERSFAEVAEGEPSGADERSFYDQYARLAEELGLEVLPPPVVPKRPSDPPPPVAPLEVETPPPAPRVETPPPAPSVEPPPAAEPPPVLPFAEAQTAGEEEQRRRSGERIPAPMPGDQLVEVGASWVPRLNRSVAGWIGVPYLWGGLDKDGVDCSAFVREVYRESLKVELPRTSRAQYVTGQPVDAQVNLRPGDLLFFDTFDRGRINHVGVYLGDGEFAHASISKGVTAARLSQPSFQHAYWGSRRVVKP